MIDLEDPDGVALLTSHQKVFSSGIDRKIPRNFDLVTLVSGRRQFPCVLVHLEYGNTIVTSVRTVDEFSGRMNHDFRRGVTFGLLGKRCESLKFHQRPGLRVVFHGRKCRRHLIDDVSELAARVEREVARTSSRSELHWLCGRLFQAAVLRAELVDENLVESEIGHERKPIRGIQVDRVGVWSLLTAWIDAGTLVLDEGGRLAKPTLFIDPQSGYTSATVVRNENILPSLVHDQVTRSCPLGRSLVQKLQLSGHRIERKRIHSAGWLPFELRQFTDGVEKISGRVDGQERRVLCDGCKLWFAEFSRFEIQHRAVNSLAVPTRIRAEEDPQFFRRRWFLGKAGLREQECTRQEQTSKREKAVHVVTQW